MTIDNARTLRWYTPDGTPAHTVDLTRLDGRDPTAATNTPTATAGTGPPGHPNMAPPTTGPPGDASEASALSRHPDANGPPGQDPPQLFEPGAA